MIIILDGKRGEKKLKMLEQRERNKKKKWRKRDRVGLQHVHKQPLT